MPEPNASPPGHRPVDRLPLDLARTSVFIDFDGTITLADTGVHVRERLALPGWRDVGDAYGRSEIVTLPVVLGGF